MKLNQLKNGKEIEFLLKVLRSNTTPIIWIKETNIILKRFYLKSLPQQTNFKKRLINIWNEIGFFE